MHRASSEEIEKRAMDEAEYMIQTGCTVRECAKAFGVSKTLVHKDMVERLRGISATLFEGVRAVLDTNKEERASRGGKALRGTHRRKKK